MRATAGRPFPDARVVLSAGRVSHPALVSPQQPELRAASRELIRNRPSGIAPRVPAGEQVGRAHTTRHAAGQTACSLGRTAEIGCELLIVRHFVPVWRHWPLPCTSKMPFSHDEMAVSYV
jgi:hypothetical protein